MALVRWRPFRDLVSIQDEMNRLFNDFFGRVPSRFEGDLSASEWNPSVDISETKDEIVVKAEVPGMKKDDIKINLQDNVLTLKGERKQEKEEKETNFYRMERCYGSFTRSFNLPTMVQADKIKASYKDGILNITLPKAEEVKPKQIPIEIS
ncbi:MAG: Hsp20/alpha crystallin family protein [Candidatus Zixiibacteriota bacterium]